MHALVNVRVFHVPASTCTGKEINGVRVKPRLNIKRGRRQTLHLVNERPLPNERCIITTPEASLYMGHCCAVYGTLLCACTVYMGHCCAHVQCVLTTGKAKKPCTTPLSVWCRSGRFGALSASIRPFPIPRDPFAVHGPRTCTV